MSTLIGVGTGPGDPELMTARAVRVLREADRVLAPATALDAVGRAESIVRQACPDVDVERIAYDMSAGDAGERGATAAAEQVVAYLDTGEKVAFVTLGDPNIYSTFTALATAVEQRRPDVRIETVPGIMAFQELAARAGSCLLQGTERLALVTALDGPADFESALADHDQAVVVYKGGRHLPALADRLAAADRLDGALAGELLGLPGERVSPVADVAAAPAAYLTTVVVPPAGRS